MKPNFFKNQNAFRNWLAKNHTNKTEFLVGFYKVRTGKPSMSWSESVDQALCFGWIDGLRKSIDSDSYSIRFTPRRSNSIWSSINIDKVKKLTNRGLMLPAGLASFEKRTEEKSAVYSYENEPATINTELEAKFKAKPEAWKFFEKQEPSYKRTCYHWIMTAKREKTRVSRLESLIRASGAGTKI